ncbi:MAG: type I DNA topoisomerase [Eubacterium sp.]|nr:type I DNA topoisomerase [Candidatus Colimonas fimequi]
MATAKKTLVIVESPSKAKTIGKFLGSRYKVMASVGHVRDLPKSKLGVDIDNDFEPQYISIRGKGSLIKELKKEAKHASKIYLATDPDREGEAISWHLAYLLGIDNKSKCRIVFNEITQKTIKEAIKNPREIDLSLVDAQQARRVLDRLVGYQISPLLWRKVRTGLSAGRVQSAALKIICDRENLIRNFVPEEYWTIDALFNKGKSFIARLAEKNGKKLAIANKEEADQILADLAQGKYVVNSLDEKERIRKPAAPYTTSSMQQDASNKINFTAKKTMMVAQQLYEGVDIKGRGTIGLVSYIRTDSVRISDEARQAAKDYILANIGEEYYSNNFYSNKKKDVQDAHEAIRPSHVELSPEDIKDSLTKDQYKLYRLIWNRFMASQMTPARFMAVNAAIGSGPYTFKATGSKLLFDGFLKINPPGKDADLNKLLPQMEVGEELALNEIKSEQNFTQPPARFTEASLVKDLEEKEIGRPSTYAPIVATLTDRKYVKKDKKYLVPTDLGFIVTEMIEQYFKEIVDADFTAQMESQLDDVEISDKPWKDVIRGFYGDFSKELEIAEKEIQKVELEDEPTGEICDKCGKPMVKKHGRFGVFAACQGYPECKNTKPIVQSIGVSCPTCGKDIVQRRSKRGRIFYGCSGYPDCQQSYWNKPVNRKCPLCGSLLTEKPGKGEKYECSSSECNYKED